jgi:hypothetical protein
MQLQMRLNKVIERNFVLAGTRFDQGFDLSAHPRDEDVLARLVTINVLVISENDKYDLKDCKSQCQKKVHLDGDF